MTGFLIKVGGAIGQFALKNSKFHKQGDFTGLDSARKLARKLFNVLSGVKLAKSRLVVEGELYPTTFFPCVKQYVRFLSIFPIYL